MPNPFLGIKRTERKALTIYRVFPKSAWPSIKKCFHLTSKKIGLNRLKKQLKLNLHRNPYANTSTPPQKKRNESVPLLLQFVYSTSPARAMASTALQAPVALGFRVRRRVEPSVSLSICRVAILGGSPLQLTLSRKSQSGL
jgi:hypothetical protein